MGLPDPLLPLAARPNQAAVFVDFDGSISEIVEDPGAARVMPAARAALTTLTGRVARVAVVSGRPVEFLAREVWGNQAAGDDRLSAEIFQAYIEGTAP